MHSSYDGDAAAAIDELVERVKVAEALLAEVEKKRRRTDMKYEELIEALKSILPEKVSVRDLIGTEGFYGHSGPMVYEDPEPYLIEEAINMLIHLKEENEKLEKEIASREESSIAQHWEVHHWRDLAKSAERRAEMAEKNLRSVLECINNIRQEYINNIRQNLFQAIDEFNYVKE